MMTFNNPPLSVIIANFNNSIYLAECIDSVLKQNFKDFEIVVFDDCSTDNSIEILKKYEKKFPEKIKLICSNQNVGVARARHEAILESKGEYITTLDSDDFYYTVEKLQKEMLLINKYYSENATISFSKILRVDNTGNFLGYQFERLPIKEGKIFEEILTRSCFIPRDFIVNRKTYFEVGGFDFDIPLYEDWDLKIRLAEKCAFYYTGIDGTAYRQHNKGLSSKDKQTHLKWILYILRKYIEKDTVTDKKQVSSVMEKYLSLYEGIRTENIPP